MADLILSEFKEAIAATRRVLERVPEDRLSFRPHGWSMTLGQLTVYLRLVDVPLPPLYGLTADKGAS